MAGKNNNTRHEKRVERGKLTKPERKKKNQRRGKEPKKDEKNGSRKKNMSNASKTEQKIQRKKLKKQGLWGGMVGGRGDESDEIGREDQSGRPRREKAQKKTNRDPKKRIFWGDTLKTIHNPEGKEKKPRS